MNTKLIRDKIKSGEIKSWSDVYGYCSLNEMVEAFGRSVKHWKYVKENPLLMHLEDMFTVVRVLKITRGQFYGLVVGQD